MILTELPNRFPRLPLCQSYVPFASKDLSSSNSSLGFPLARWKTAAVSSCSASAPRRPPSWFSHTWQGRSHFSPRHPGAHVHVPSRVLQAPPLRHWQVKLQLKPHVPLGQLMEQSTPCQPATTRTPEHGAHASSRECHRTSPSQSFPLETCWRRTAGSPAQRAAARPHTASISNDHGTQNPPVP